MGLVSSLPVENDLYFLHTWDHVSCIQGVIILDEAKTIHEFGLRDVARSILEMILDVFLGDCKPDTVVSRVPEGHIHGK